MPITATATDEAILRELGDRLARYRLERNLTQRDVAREAGLSLRTVWRLESGGVATLASLVRVLRVLDLLSGFDQFVPPAGPGPMEELERHGKARQRASKRKRAA